MLSKNDTNSCILCSSHNIRKKKANFFPFICERMFKNNEPITTAIECKNCGFIYSEYRPTDSEMECLYKNYRDEAYQQQRQFFEPSYTKELNFSLGHNQEARKIRLENIISNNCEYSKISSVLDYGGDEGQFIPALFKHSKKFVYEISNVKTIDGIQSISDRNELLSNKFDFVMCCHVLEHVSQPNEIMKELWSLVSGNGYLYIELPHEAISNWRNEPVLIHEHISRYSISTLFYLSKIFKDSTIIDISSDDSLSILLKKEKITDLKRFIKNSKKKIKYYILANKSFNKTFYCLRRFLLFLYLIK